MPLSRFALLLWILALLRDGWRLVHGSDIHPETGHVQLLAGQLDARMQRVPD